MQAATAPAAERALELELELARERDLYLVVHLAERRLEVKARGIVLDAIPLTDGALTRYVPPGTPEGTLETGLPALRFVVEPDPRAVRTVVTATELVPYPGDGEPSVAPPAPEAAGHGPRAADAEPPASYRVGLDSGWDLWIDPAAVGPSIGERLGRVLLDRWRSLRGRPAVERVILGLAMTPEDGRRLHHLLGEGAVLLVR
jgi:hypothetical protein